MIGLDREPKQRIWIVTDLLRTLQPKHYSPFGRGHQPPQEPFMTSDGSSIAARLMLRLSLQSEALTKVPRLGDDLASWPNSAPPRGASPKGFALIVKARCNSYGRIQVPEVSTIPLTDCCGYSDCLCHRVFNGTDTCFV